MGPKSVWSLESDSRPTHEPGWGLASLVTLTRGVSDPPTGQRLTHTVPGFGKYSRAWPFGGGHHRIRSVCRFTLRDRARAVEGCPGSTRPCHTEGVRGWVFSWTAPYLSLLGASVSPWQTLPFPPLQWLCVTFLGFSVSESM